MLLTDLVFLCVMIPLALIFTVLTFIYKGLKWMAYIPAVLWLIVGLFTITNAGVFAYQQYLSLIFFGFAVAMLFMPWAMREGSPIEDIGDEEESAVWNEKDETYANLYEDSELKGKKGKRKIEKYM